VDNKNATRHCAEIQQKNMKVSAILSVTKNNDPEFNEKSSKSASMSDLRRLFEKPRRVHHIGFAPTGNVSARDLTSSDPITVKNDASEGDSASGTLFEPSDVMLRKSHVIQVYTELLRSEENQSEVTASTTNNSSYSSSHSVSSMSTVNTNMHNAQREVKQIYSRGLREFQECLMLKNDSTFPVREAVIQNANSALAHLDLGLDLGLDDDVDSILSLDSL